MIFAVVLVFLGSGLSVHGEQHSLHYIYTALSRPVNSPGIHEFTAMGLLDGNMIDYFDSDQQVKVPKQSWMKSRLEENYWEKGTQSRKSKQQWFKVNINILRDRFRQNDSDIHVLQWIHGCDIDTRETTSEPKFLHGIDMYSYDGANFLSFDETNENWVAPSEAALQTKRKWDDLQVLKEYTKIYLKKECVNWLTTFLKYQKENGSFVKPDVFLLSRSANVQTNMVLTCMATGFSSIHTIIQIKRDGRVLTRHDGVESTGVRPNGDGTFQRKDHVEIPKSEHSKYTCEVIHASSGVHEVRAWDHVEDDNTILIIAFVVVGLLFITLIGVVLTVVIKKFVLGKPRAVVKPGATNVLLHNNGVPTVMVSPGPTTLLLHNNGVPTVMVPLEATGLLQNKGSDPSLDSGVPSSGSSTRSDSVVPR